MPAKSWKLDFPTDHREISQYFEEKSPVFVEVRFSRCGTSSDYHLLNDYEEFIELAKSINGPRISYYLISAWDIESSEEHVRIDN